MSRGIHDEFSCLVKPQPKKGSYYPPPIFLTHCIYEAITPYHISTGHLLPRYSRPSDLLFNTNDPKGQNHD